MIPLTPPVEPNYFHLRVRLPGQKYLNKYPSGTRFPSHWRRCIDDLAEASLQRCAYTGMFISEGSVDHFKSKKTHRDLAYEWSNYRYSSFTVNSKKKEDRPDEPQILDPYQIEDNWFEISLPDLQLHPTDNIPENIRASAIHTITKLGLIRGRHVMKQRQALYIAYKKGQLSIDYINEQAPLLATALRNQLHPEAVTEALPE